MRFVQAVLQKALDERLYTPDLVSSFLHYAAGTLLIFIWSLAHVLQVVAWSIAVLVLGINMYLLGVSVLSSLVHSVSAIIVLGISSAAYGAFICYLVLDPAQEDGNWSFLKNLFSRSTLLSVCLSLFCHVVVEYNKLHISQN